MIELFLNFLPREGQPSKEQYRTHLPAVPRQDDMLWHGGDMYVVKQVEWDLDRDTITLHVIEELPVA